MVLAVELWPELSLAVSSSSPSRISEVFASGRGRLMKPRVSEVPTCAFFAVRQGQVSHRSREQW